MRTEEFVRVADERVTVLGDGTGGGGMEGNSIRDREGIAARCITIGKI